MTAAPGLQAAGPCGDAWGELEGRIVAFAEQRSAARQVLKDQQQALQLLVEKMSLDQDVLLKEVLDLARAQSSTQPAGAVRAIGVDVPVSEPAPVSPRSQEPGPLARTISEATPFSHVCSKQSTPNAERPRQSLVSAEPSLHFADTSILAALDHNMLMKIDSDVPQRVSSMSGPSRRRRSAIDLAQAQLSWSIKGARAAAVKVLASRLFEPMMGGFILINAANIGWAIDRELRYQDTSLQDAIELVLLGIFIAEILLRYFVHGLKCVKSPWNLFDSILISMTILSMVISAAYDSSSPPAFIELMQQMLILKMLRLLRLVRAVRLVAMCRSLWKFGEGLKHCLGTMVSAFIIMFLSTFFFACFGAEFISKVLRDDPDVGEIVRANFATIPKIMLTLFQFISMDSIAGFYVPLIHRSPVLAIYFGLLLVLVSIALMNLVTAMLVEDAISTTKMDSEMLEQHTRKRLKVLRPALQKFFRSLDYSEDGAVSIQEVCTAIKDGLQIPDEIRDIVNPARMLDLFDAIDQDNSGDLTETEFVEGLSCVALSEMPLETMQILHHLRILRRELAACKVAMGLRHTEDVKVHADLRHAEDVKETEAHLRRFDSPNGLEEIMGSQELEAFRRVETEMKEEMDSEDITI